MAIWQVAFNLITIDKDFKYTEVNLWDIARTFPQEKSWCKTIKQYGKLDSTCIEFDLCDNLIIDSISLRIDLRNIMEYQLQIICDFINNNGLLLEYQNTLYEASVCEFKKIFQKSRAYSFLTQGLTNQLGDGSLIDG